MQSEEQRLIDDLFARLAQAESHSAPRDAGAESLINTHLRQQSAAPYYMAQTILIQEAALRQLNARVEALEAQLAERKQSSGGFLAGLFGVGESRPQASTPLTNGQAIPGSRSYQNTGQNGYAPAQQAATAQRGGFMAGALQTAAGVAGGVMLGNLLTGLFQHTQPQEIVNIINEPPQEASQSQADTTVPQDNDLTQADFRDDSDLNDDNFGGDDDSWI